MKPIDAAHAPATPDAAGAPHRSMRIGKRHDPEDDFVAVAPSVEARATQLHKPAPNPPANSAASSVVRPCAPPQPQR